MGRGGLIPLFISQLLNVAVSRKDDLLCMGQEGYMVSCP